MFKDLGTNTTTVIRMFLTQALEGWKKCIIPARKYLVTEVMPEHYTEPSTGKNSIFFPVEDI